MKSPKSAILFVFLFSFFILNGQSYSSSFEREVFDLYKKDSLNYNFFSSLFATDSLMNDGLTSKFQLRVDELINKFPPKENKAKKEKKRIKYIYDVLHKAFFKKYVLDSYFSDIFKDGTYNCVTASALYTYVFEKLNVPYHIKETPTHVFLIAYPNTHRIYLETTVPGAYGFLVLDESDIKKIVDELIAYKIVTKEEVLAKGYTKFYEDYYYGKEYIDKSSLIGMQYYNKGIVNSNTMDYYNALNNMKKAKVFYSSPVMKPIEKSIMFLLVNELEFNKKRDIDTLLELLIISNYPEDYSISNLKSSLFKIINHDDNDESFILYAIERFKEIQEIKVRNEAIEFLYEYLGRNAASDEELDKALEYCNEIIQVNPKSKIAKEIIGYVSFRKILLSSYDKSALEYFEKLCDKYPFLKDTKRYYINMAHLYANISLELVKNKKIAEGKEYRKKLEKILDNNDIIDDINKLLLSDLYLKTGNYYYYKDQYKSSYQIYKKGLIYLPNNNDLKKKAQWSREEF